MRECKVGESKPKEWPKEGYSCNICGEKGYSVYSCPNKCGFKTRGEALTNKETSIKNHYVVVPKDLHKVHYNPVGAKGRGILCR